MRQSRDGLILVKGEDDGHLHVRVDVPAAFASGFEFPFRYSLHGCGFKFALRHFDGKRILDIAVGIDDEVDDHLSRDTCAAHLKGVGRAPLQAGTGWLSSMDGSNTAAPRNWDVSRSPGIVRTPTAGRIPSGGRGWTFWTNDVSVTIWGTSVSMGALSPSA